MASSYTSLLRLEQQADGENSNTWGQKQNNNHVLIEEAISGMETVNVAGAVDVTLTTSNGSSDQARNAILKFTGALTGNINVIVPSVSGKYVVWNATTGSFTLTVKTAAGTGILITQGATDVLFSDGTNVKRSADGGANQTQFISLGFKGAHSVGDDKDRVPVPPSLNGKSIVGAIALGGTAGITGTAAFQIRNSRAGDVFSTKITFDTTEKMGGTTFTGNPAATPAVINAANDDLQTADILYLDTDVVQTTPGVDFTVILEVR